MSERLEQALSFLGETEQPLDWKDYINSVVVIASDGRKFLVSNGQMDRAAELAAMSAEVRMEDALVAEVGRKVVGLLLEAYGDIEQVPLDVGVLQTVKGIGGATAKKVVAVLSGGDEV